MSTFQLQGFPSTGLTSDLPSHRPLGAEVRFRVWFRVRVRLRFRFRFRAGATAMASVNVRLGLGLELGLRLGLGLGLVFIHSEEVQRLCLSSIKE